MELGDGVRFRAHPSVSDTYPSTTSARMGVTAEHRKGLTLPQGNHFGSQDPLVQQCTDISNAAMQRGHLLAARLGTDWVDTGQSQCRKVLSLPQGSVTQRCEPCEAGRCMTSTEVLA